MKDYYDLTTIIKLEDNEETFIDSIFQKYCLLRTTPEYYCM